MISFKFYSYVSKISSLEYPYFYEGNLNNGRNFIKNIYIW